VTPNSVRLSRDISDPSKFEVGLVMELVTGGDLFDYILSAGYLSEHFTLWWSFANYILAEDRAGPLTAELCDAMAVCHRPEEIKVPD
jgi:serine/threonine protein kinase